MSRDADGEQIDAPDAPDYEDAPEEGLDLGLLTPDDWRSWPLWAKLRFLRRLRTQGAGRPEQYVDDKLAFYLWLLLGGRGSGKSDEASRWSAEDAERLVGIRFAFVARTFADVRDTMFEGETGVLAVLPDYALKGGSRDKAYNRSLGELFLANGSRFKGFSSEKPNQLRGPQHHRAWLDEASSWDDADVPPLEKADGTLAPAVDTTMSNLMLGLRLKTPDGSPVRMVCATTPKPNELTGLLVDLAERKGQLRVLSTYSNLENLDDQVKDVVLGMYEGTDAAAQELEGKVLSAAQGAAWTDGMVRVARAAGRPRPQLTDEGVELPLESKVVVGVDPAVSSKDTSDETGVVAVERVGLDDPAVGVLADASMKMGAGEFAPYVMAFAEDREADEVVVEINNGYDFVVNAVTSWCEAQGWTVVRRVRTDKRSVKTRSRVVVEYLLESPSGWSCVLKPVWASADKLTRAKSASVWWHRQRAWHEPGLEKLEKQMTAYDGSGKKSPDRLDALTTAVAAFSGSKRGRPPQGASPLDVEDDAPADGPRHPLLDDAPAGSDSPYSQSLR